MTSMTITSLFISRGHSTVGALLKVHSDIAQAIEKSFMATLIILYLSAAFVVIDYSILLNSLEFFSIITEVLNLEKSTFHRPTE